ncbi:MAG: hypothetical protein RLZZ450_781 [Pseudomonadota bacterium]|jgi:hypothetical protein
MTTRIHTNITRLIVTLSLAQLALADRVVAQSNAPQRAPRTAPPAAPVVAPAAPVVAPAAPVVAPTAPIVVPAPATAPTTAPLPTAAPVAPSAQGPGVGAAPAPLPPAATDPATNPALPPFDAEPPALAVEAAPPPPALAPPVEQEPVALPVPEPKRPRRERSASSADGDDLAPDLEPLFQVGRYRVRASGYVQAQYQRIAESQDELSQDGLRLLNQTSFFVPRARALIEGSNDWSSLVIEYDVASINNPATAGVQRAEASLLWRNPSNARVPYLSTTFGVFRTPFGNEAARSARVRLFAENATITRAFFPGQSDTGFRAEGGVAWFRYALAFVNGHPINEPRWGGRAPLKQGDVLGRLGVDTQMGRVRLFGGGSLLKGRGISPGAPASKDTITVRDVSESGVVTAQSVTLVPGRSATASQTFERWGMGVDLEVAAQVLDVWRLWVRGEFMFGQNLDRGLFVSDPAVQGFDGRGYGAVGSIESLLYQVGLLGVRYDFYEPNPDSTSRVGGDIVKVPRSISTTSVLAGFQLPGTSTRVFAEYDRVKDHLALSLDGRPADLKNDRFLLRLQVSLW